MYRTFAVKTFNDIKGLRVSPLLSGAGMTIALDSRVTEQRTTVQVTEGLDTEEENGYLLFVGEGRLSGRKR